jgi:hypothetical protein
MMELRLAYDAKDLASFERVCLPTVLPFRA